MYLYRVSNHDEFICFRYPVAHRCLGCRKIRGCSFSPNIMGACGTQTRCSCSHINLVFKSTFLTTRLGIPNGIIYLVFEGSHFASIIA